MAYTLLLADDSLTIRRVVELTFAEEDLSVTTVADGRRAMECIASLRPDIVLADVGMRPPGGYDIAAFVKASPELSHIPVILLTAAFQPIDEARAQAVGCDAVLEKPFELARLVARVKELLPAESQEQDGTATVTEDAVPGSGSDDQAAADSMDAGEAALAVPDWLTKTTEPSLDERFDSIDAGAHCPVPFPPGSSWTSDRDGRRMSLDDFFDHVDASTRREPAGAASAGPAQPAEAETESAGSNATAAIPGDGAASQDLGKTPQEAGDAPSLPEEAAGLPDAVTRTFLSLLDTAAVPSPPDLVERAVRLLLDGGSASGQ